MTGVYDTGGKRLKENQRLPLGGLLRDHELESVFAADGFRGTLRFPTEIDPLDPPHLRERYYLYYQQDALGRLEWIQGPEGPAAPPAEDPWQPRDLARYRYVGGRVWSRWYGNETELRMYDEPAPGQKVLKVSTESERCSRSAT